jgi:hypothetical protein
VIREWPLFGKFALGAAAGRFFVGQASHSRADALHQAGTQHGAVGHIKKLIFERRTAAVENKNFHGAPHIFRKTLPVN